MKAQMTKTMATAVEAVRPHPFAQHEAAFQSMIRLRPLPDSIDAKGADALFDSAYGAAISAAARFCGKVHLKPAEECGMEAVHELFCQLRPHAAKGYKADRPLFPYVYSALWYIVQGMAAKHRRFIGDPICADFADDQAGPAERAEVHEVRFLLDRLPAGLRRVVELRYLEGMSARATAQILEITPGAVDNRAHRACRQLLPLLK